MSKKIVENIKKNNERFVSGLKTNFREFKYKDTSGFVKPNTIYTIYYTNNKKEYYLTGLNTSTNNRVIEKISNNTLFSMYTALSSNFRSNYIKQTTLKLRDKDYNNEFITRYFARQANDKNQKVFEISEQDFNLQTPFYDKLEVKWTIKGIKLEVISRNTTVINEIQDFFKSNNININPLQFWKPPKDSKEDLENKLSRLKK